MVEVTGSATEVLPQFVISHRQVKDVSVSDTYMRVAPYGNCTLFGKIHRSGKINLGNVSTFDNGDLKLNFDILE
jgi:hypothetical protein